MHDQKKVRPGDIDEAKRQALMVKIQKYNELKNAVIAMKKKKVYTDEALELVSKLLVINPEFYSAWNYRREILLFKHANDDEETKQEMYKSELKFNEKAIEKDFKSYCSWQHRKWAVVHVPSSWDNELLLCEKLLKVDERNFHCWNYRRFVLGLLMKKAEQESRDKHSVVEKEMKYIMSKLNEDFSNYSAWHNRSSLLREEMAYVKSDKTIGELIDEDFDLVQSACFTEPGDQSAWIYHRWHLTTFTEKLQIADYSLNVDEANNKFRGITVSFTSPARHLTNDNAKVSIMNADETQSITVDGQWRPLGAVSKFHSQSLSYVFEVSSPDAYNFGNGHKLNLLFDFDQADNEAATAKTLVQSSQQESQIRFRITKSIPLTPTANVVLSARYVRCSTSSDTNKDHLLVEFSSPSTLKHVEASTVVELCGGDAQQQQIKGQWRQPVFVNPARVEESEFAAKVIRPGVAGLIREAEAEEEEGEGSNNISDNYNYNNDATPQKLFEFFPESGDVFAQSEHRIKVTYKNNQGAAASSAICNVVLDVEAMNRDQEDELFHEKVEKELQICDELLEIEPDSKWAVLTKVHTQRAALQGPMSLDVHESNSDKNALVNKYQRELLKNLNKLTTLDSWHKGYYNDMKSRFIMEFASVEYDLHNRIYSPVYGLDLSNCALTRLDSLNSLLSVRTLDLSNNSIASMKGLETLVVLEHLNMNNNRVSILDMNVVSAMPRLTKLLLQNNDVNKVNYNNKEGTRKPRAVLLVIDLSGNNNISRDDVLVGQVVGENIDFVL